MFDISILALTAVAMLLVWWAYRKWHGRGYLTAVFSVLSFALGAFLLYLHFTGAIFGRIKTPDSAIFCPSGTSPGRCAATYFRETDPTAFWLTLAFWILVDTTVIAAGAFGLYRLWRARQRGHGAAQDPRRRVPWWLAATVCAIVLLASLFAWEHEAERQGLRGEAKREPLQLRFEPDVSK